MPIENTRFIAYARAHGRTPEAQLEEDRRRWPGGVMVGFVQWNAERLREASAEIPQAFYMGRLTDHDAYDEWLSKRAERYFEEMSS